MSVPETQTRSWALDTIYYAASAAFLIGMLYYYWTGVGGATLLAMTMIPLTFALFTIRSLRENDFYPGLPPFANYTIAPIYLTFTGYCAYYLNTNYLELGEIRSGFWNTQDLIVGAGMTALVVEYARKRHMPLFVLNVLLMLYAVYGYIVPGMFFHPGLTWQRVIAASSLETTTGIFADLSQMALTVIGSFLLVLAALAAFGVIDSLLRATKRLARRSVHAIPQSAVVGSMAIGSISGSSAANSITVGSATIPLMIGIGMPRATAAAIENAASMGGQLLPPVMGIAAFLMAEFLGVDYLDVVARGWVIGLLFFASVSVSVYLLTIRHCDKPLPDIKVAKLTWRDKLNLAAFIAVVAGLIALMATMHLAPMFAALYIFIGVGGTLFLVNTAAVATASSNERTWSAFLAPLKRFIDAYTEMMVDICLLLATLSVMVGALVITGIPTKLGALLIQAGGVNLVAMVAMAFIFGTILGTGLPPAPTYILVAIVIAPPFIQVGVNPWVIHFFAFFIAVYGELTPPTSIAAAITSKIANASFYLTMWRSVQICMTLFAMMVGIFVHPELVIQPGLDQIFAALLIGAATVGLTFSVQARFARNNSVDLAARLSLAAIALFVLLSSNKMNASIASLLIVCAIGCWACYSRRTDLDTESTSTPESRPAAV